MIQVGEIVEGIYTSLRSKLSWCFMQVSKGVNKRVPLFVYSTV